jgi:hypothetical protein
MTIWNLIKQFMKDTEAANNIIFAESAWQRAKQLEKDILAEHWIDLDEKRVQSLSAKAEFDALVESSDKLFDEQDKRNIATEAVLDEIYANARMIVETQTEMKLPHWNLVKMIVDRIEAHKKANG